MKKNILIALLIIINAALIWKVGSLNKKMKTSSEIVKGNEGIVPYFVLNDLQGREWSMDRIIDSKPYALLVFFTLKDCAGCLLENVLWEKVYRKQNINVVGIAQHVDERELKAWVENTQMTFPVLFDKKGEVAELFKIKSTPQKLLINREGKILWMDSVRVNQRQMDEFLLQLDKMIPKEQPR